MQDVSSMSVLVTGGGSGLGAAIARHLTQRGARVTISGRRIDRLKQVAADIGPDCAFVRGDVASDTDRQRMIETAVEHGGGLQGLVNTAGNMLRGPITELKADEILDLLNTNVVAGMALTGLAVPHLERDGGAVLFIGSVHTRRAFPGASPYAASKGAVEVLSRVLAAELGPKSIRVNCLLPGAVPTEINVRAGIAKDFDDNLARLRSMENDHPLGRIGRPEEIAEAAEYLLCAEWTTGTSIVVDGGLALGVSYK
jgi:NAD(P)-dependent dehydrogenase (short-subunit alcohol dehydrogenase family)